MPRNEKGEVYLSFWHGFFTWCLLPVWTAFWIVGGLLLVPYVGKLWGDVIVLLGLFSWIVMLLLFLYLEAHKCPKEKEVR